MRTALRATGSLLALSISLATSTVAQETTGPALLASTNPPAEQIAPVPNPASASNAPTATAANPVAVPEAPATEAKPVVPVMLPEGRALPDLSMPTAPPLFETAPPAVVEPKAEPTPAAIQPAIEQNSQRLQAIVAEIRQRLQRPASGATVQDREDRQALQEFYAREGASPIWVDDKGLTAKGRAISKTLSEADDWGLRSRDYQQPAEVASTDDDLADAEVRLATSALRYARHARGGRVNPLDLSNYLDRKPNVLPAKQVVEGLSTAAEPDRFLTGLHPQHPQFEKLRQAYLELRRAPPAKPEPAAAVAEAPQQKGAKKKEKAAEPAAPALTVRKLIANMEMWRWMPADLGERHIFANVPEFQFRYMKQGKAIHTERVIVGKVQNQTPIFTDMMEHIIFHPTWNVPDSIKVKELLPNLVRGGNALERQGLRATLNGRPVNASAIDWAAVDIRNVHVYQPSGQGNALGLMKFMFPNQHAVYMHDTPTKPLFNSASRAFSHGCVRVRNPQRFAEVILAEDKGWGSDKIKALLDDKIENNQVNLTTRIPVHVAYFTTWVDDDGKMHAYRDVYGYEDKIHLGLDGKAHLIVKKKENLGQIRAEVVGRLVETRASKPADVFSFFEKLFNN